MGVLERCADYLDLSEEWAGLDSKVQTRMEIGALMGLISLVAMFAMMFVVFILILLSLSSGSGATGVVAVRLRPDD